MYQAAILKVSTKISVGFSAWEDDFSPFLPYPLASFWILQVPNLLKTPAVYITDWLWF